MQQRLDELYPWVSNMLGAYLIGEDSLELEIDDVVTTQGPERAALALDELRRLLADESVSDDELTTFVDTTTPWMIETGRTTLEHVADRLAETLEQTTSG
jgi:hypothetical protein